MLDKNLKNAKILIIDDQQHNIDVLTGLLEITGYKNYTTCSDSRKVTDLYNTFKPHLILLDLMMPHFDGFQIMEQLKSLVSAGTFLPILVLTADIKTETKQQALSNGASDFLTKPFDLIEVELRTRNLLKSLYLHQQLENQNLILEEKVKERTAELEKTNIELVASKDKAEESNRLKTAFLSNMSHEIRTPMNGILNFSELLKDPELKIEKQQVFLNVIEKSAKRLLVTVNNIVDISKIESGLMNLYISEFDLNKQIEEIEAFFIPETEKKGIQFIVTNTIPNQDSLISSDSEKIHSILLNLVKNAIKFTMEGSVELVCSKKGNRLEFYVKDTGIGIPLDRQPFIFDRFVQADIEDKAVYEGSGLGLAISKAYAEMLGGKLWVKSEYGNGSIFYFTMPLQTGEKEQKNFEDPTKATDYSNKINKIKILIAEDDKNSSILLGAILADINSEILYAKTGVEAVETCQEHPDINLILMDVKMNGYEATKQIRLFNENIIIIAQSAYALVGESERAINAGCNSYISKPFTKVELMDQLYEYFAVTTVEKNNY
ncbi:MAG: response regulator [Lutibacter sp.]